MYKWNTLIYILCVTWVMRLNVIFLTLSIILSTLITVQESHVIICQLCVCKLDCESLAIRCVLHFLANLTGRVGKASYFEALGYWPSCHTWQVGTSWLDGARWNPLCHLFTSRHQHIFHACLLRTFTSNPRLRINLTSAAANTVWTTKYIVSNNGIIWQSAVYPLSVINAS